MEYNGIISSHLTYYFKNRLYLHLLSYSSYRTNIKTNIFNNYYPGTNNLLC